MPQTQIPPGTILIDCEEFDKLRAQHAEMLEALKATAAVMRALFDRGEWLSYHELPGYGGKTFYENLRHAESVIAKVEGR